jgi:photosystem II stability/assembly factor-like uncharacterized protein
MEVIMKKYFVTLVFFVLVTSVSNAQGNWVSQTSPLGSVVLGKIRFVSSTEGWICAGNGKLLHTTNAGTNWLAVNASGTDTVFVLSDPSRAMSFINATNGWVIGSLGSTSAPKGAVLYNTINSGTTWNKQLLTSWSMGLFIQFVDVNNGWAVVANGNLNAITSGALIHTTNGGTTWTPLSTPLGNTYFIDANNGWGLGDSNKTHFILHTTNGGTSWSTQLTDTSLGGYLALQFIDANNGWVVGDSAKILKTTNGGSNWTRITNTGNNLRHKAVFFLNANVGWIGSRVISNQGKGLILHTTNGGGSWTLQDTPSQYDVFSIYFVDANNGWLTGDYGFIGHTTNGGETSVEETNNSISTGYSLSQNYPNPFNPSTNISFSLLSKSSVSLKIFDLLGREVATVISDNLSAGNHTQQWNANGMPSGVYFYHLQAGSFSETKKLVLLR